MVNPQTSSNVSVPHYFKLLFTVISLYLSGTEQRHDCFETCLGELHQKIVPTYALIDKCLVGIHWGKHLPKHETEQAEILQQIEHGD